jgi:hypothetical protein
MTSIKSKGSDGLIPKNLKEVERGVRAAIWVETPPVRFLGALRDLLQVHLRRQYFNDAFARYKKKRGKRVGEPGCITRSRVFIDLNRSYYEHMLIGIRRAVGGGEERISDEGKRLNRSTYSLCAILSELEGVEGELSVKNGYDISWLRKRFIGREVRPNIRTGRVTKDLKRQCLIPGSVYLLKGALASYVERLTEIVNKHLGHLATEESQRGSKSGDLTTFEVRDRDIIKVLRRIVDVYDALEHLFAAKQEYWLIHEESDSYADYERLMGLTPDHVRSRRLFTKMKGRVSSWKHGDLTSALVRRASCARLKVIVDAAADRAARAKLQNQCRAG